MSDPNPHERAARLEKATRLAIVLNNHGFTGDDAELLTREQWNDLAEAIDVRPPSDITIEHVVDLLARMNPPRQPATSAVSALLEAKDSAG